MEVKFTTSYQPHPHGTGFSVRKESVESSQSHFLAPESFEARQYVANGSLYVKNQRGFRGASTKENCGHGVEPA